MKAPIVKLQDINSLIPEIFSGYIGQQQAKEIFARAIQLYRAGVSMPFPKTLLTGAAGAGKSLLAKTIAAALGNPHSENPADRFGFVEFPSSVTLPTFLQTWANLIEGKPCVIFIDEAHDLRNPKVVNLIKRLTETDGGVQGVSMGETSLTSNPFQHLWIMASNEDVSESALFGPTGRFTTVHLQPLEVREQSQALAKFSAAYGVSVEKDAAKLLLRHCDPSPRSIRIFCERAAAETLGNGGSVVTTDHVSAIIEREGRNLLGLSAMDVRTLRFMASQDVRGVQVNAIAAHCFGEAKKVTSARLMALGGLGFVSTPANGRKAITSQGRGYLVALDESKAKKDSAKETAKPVTAKGKGKGETAKDSAKG